MFHKLAGLVVLGLSLAAGPAAANADSYPCKSVRLEVGFAPGGGTDIVARLLAAKLTQALGQTFVVENKSGATGMIAAKVVATSPADGCTLLMGHVNSQAIAPALSDHPQYDPVKDFSPVAYVGYSPNVLVINSATPVKTVAELIALAKTRPTGLSFASPGVGSTNHLAGEMLRIASGAKLFHVPYRGSGPATVDLLAGRVDMNFDTTASIMPYIKSGRMRALAVTGLARYPELPDVPTMAELGFKSFDITNWYGIVAPAGTPAPIVKTLHAAIDRILAQPDMDSQFAKLGIRRNVMTVDQFARFNRVEFAKYQEFAKQTGIRMEQ
jgi:tripartite-type tricarboxylate transporter receptor subunit TctC